MFINGTLNADTVETRFTTWVSESLRPTLEWNEAAVAHIIFVQSKWLFWGVTGATYSPRFRTYFPREEHSGFHAQ